MYIVIGCDTVVAGRLPRLDGGFELRSSWSGPRFVIFQTVDFKCQKQKIAPRNIFPGFVLTFLNPWNPESRISNS